MRYAAATILVTVGLLLLFVPVDMVFAGKASGYFNDELDDGIIRVLLVAATVGGAFLASGVWTLVRR
jgi:hypothetical protein